MKRRYILLIALVALALSPAAYAGQAAAPADQAPQVAADTAPAAVEMAADAGATCGEVALERALDPLADIAAEGSCPGGFPVSSCNECVGCFCQKIMLCCYCP